MKSKAYWIKRAVEVETYLQSQADNVKDGVIKAYERAIKNVNNDIEKTFKAYISTEIPEKEARRLMSIADSDKQYEELLELYDETDDKTVKKEILNRINAQAYGARISRLEGLKRNVYIYFRHVANEAIKEQKKLYDSAVKTAYYTNIFDTAQGLNCGIDSSLVPQKAVNKVLSEPWHGHNYSERVWIHNDRFIQAVGQTIEDGIISGHSVSRMTDKLIDYVKDTAPGGIRTSAETLVRSETAHFMNQGQRMAYEEIGIKQYRFVAALSELTCDRCGSLDGSVFDTDKAVEGENYPPIHPRCRCVTIMADVNLTSRIARDPLTGENYKVDGSMTFDEWKNSLSDEQKNALKYVANSEKRGIIKVDRFNSKSDPMYEVTGSAYESNPKELEDILSTLKSWGVEINESHSLGYGALVDGSPGTLSITPDASYSAWLHEFQHVKDAKDNGWDAVRVLYTNIDERKRREDKAYSIEINLALKLGRLDIAKRLEENLNDEIKRIEEFFGIG
jgi:SPP1 gp7 family putative phage head morphogenesis protein|nr:MAG TPA: minor capsid protein [Caudoviricetes sp.]